MTNHPMNDRSALADKLDGYADLMAQGDEQWRLSERDARRAAELLRATSQSPVSSALADRERIANQKLADVIEQAHIQRLQELVWPDKARIVRALRATSQPPASSALADELAKILDGWARAYRDTPEHRFPSDPHAEFFPVDLENAAKILRTTSPTTDAVRDAAEDVCSFDYADVCPELQHDIEKLRAALSAPTAPRATDAVRDILADEINEWIDAIRHPNNQNLTLRDIAILNGECIDTVLEKALSALSSTSTPT